jgi:hypothetical protein
VGGEYLYQFNLFFACEGFKEIRRGTNRVIVRHTAAAICKLARKCQLKLPEEAKKSLENHEHFLNGFEFLQMEVEKAIKNEIVPAFIKSKLFLQCVERELIMHRSLRESLQKFVEISRKCNPDPKSYFPSIIFPLKMSRESNYQTVSKYFIGSKDFNLMETKRSKVDSQLINSSIKFNSQFKTNFRKNGNESFAWESENLRLEKTATQTKNRDRQKKILMWWQRGKKARIKIINLILGCITRDCQWTIGWIN